MSHRKIRNRGYLKQQLDQSEIIKNNQESPRSGMSIEYIWKNYGWMWLSIILAVLFIYLNSLGNEFVSDDIGGIVQNPNLNNFGSLFTSPLQALRFFHPTIQYVTYQIFGLLPGAFRATNILFHLATVTLVFFTISRLVNPGTGTIAALFAGVHPIMTESITWISGGGHVLYTLFAWVSLLFIVYKPNSKKYLAFAIFACFFAITISEKAVVFPVILIIFIWVYRIRKIKLIELLLFTGPAFIVGIIFLSKLSERSSWLQTNYYQTGERANLLIQIPVAISSYFQLIFWPNMLTLYHSELSFTTIQFLFHLVIFFGYAGLTIYCFFRARSYFFWLALFFIGLIPTLTPFGVSWIVAERYAYFSSIGIFVTLGMVFNTFIQKNKKVGSAVVIIIALLLSIRTVARNMDWKNQDTLWLATARTSPSSPQNHNNLGDYYGRQGDLVRAVEEFKIAILLNPNYADAYHNLGNTYQQMENPALALESYQKAILYNPALWQSYANIGAIYYQQNKYSEAEKALLKVTEITPLNDSVYAGLGVLYLDQNQKDKALSSFKRALEINPDNQTAQAGIKKLY